MEDWHFDFENKVDEFLLEEMRNDPASLKILLWTFMHLSTNGFVFYRNEFCWKRERNGKKSFITSEAIQGVVLYHRWYLTTLVRELKDDEFVSFNVIVSNDQATVKLERN